MIEISVNKAHAHAKKLELLTTGMSKAVDVEFAFSKDWDALKKTAVFTNGTTTRDVLLKSETSICSVPPEVLTVEGASVMCGVYGHNADGIIIPTIYVWLGNVNPGTDPSGDESVAPSLPVYEQLRTMIETHVKSIDNPHKVTAEQVGAAEVEHTHAVAAYSLENVSLIKLYESGVLTYVEDSSMPGETKITDNKITAYGADITINYSGYAEFDISSTVTNFKIDGVAADTYRFKGHLKTGMSFRVSMGDATLNWYQQTHTDGFMTGEDKQKLEECNKHVGMTNNPHNVTAEQVGSLTKEQTNQLINSALSSHKSEINPHKVTAKQVGAYTKEEVEEKLVTLKKNCCYVDGVSGNDANNGTKEAPFKTIQKGVNANTDIVYVATGDYCEAVSINNRDCITIMPTTYSNTYIDGVGDTPKIHIDHSNNENLDTKCVSIADCGSVTIIGVWADNMSGSGFYVNKVKNFELTDCIASNNSKENANGYSILSSNGKLYGCKAYNVVRDGFNIHGYGRTEFINCIAHDCGDDGISHHDGCTGSIIGGEFYNCGKGGVSSPTLGAYIEVCNVYSHDNAKYGLYITSDNTRRISKGTISNCVLKNNQYNDIFLSRCEVVAWNNEYDSVLIKETATMIEHNNTYTKTEVDEMMGDIDTALDSILAIQEALIGGAAE